MRDVEIKKNISIKIFERACVKTQKFFLTNFQFSFFSKNSDKNQFFQFAEITTNNDKERQRTTKNDKQRQRTTKNDKQRQIPTNSDKFRQNLSKYSDYKSRGQNARFLVIKWHLLIY